MIVDTKVAEYINTLTGDLSDYLDLIEQKAQSESVPIIRKDTQTLLAFLLRDRKPKRILEVGTAVGFSCLLMSEWMPQGATITTIEKVPKRIEEAQKNLANAPKREAITLLCGDACELLLTLPEEFDFIFLDAAKAQYMNFLPELHRVLISGGMLVTDNVLQDGTIARSKFTIERRDRTIHMRMREYLYELTHSDEWDTVVLPVGDGMTLSIKR